MAIEGEGIHLREGLRIIGKHRKTVMMFFTVTFGMVLLMTFTATPQYRGTTQVIIEKATPNLLAANPRYDPNDPEFNETQVQLIQSFAVARRVVDDLSLEKTYDTYMGRYTSPSPISAVVNWLEKGTAKLWSLLPFSASEAQQGKAARSRADKIAAEIQAGIDVEPVLNSRIVAISFMSPNPEFAAMVANALAKAYLEETLDMKMEASRSNISWMTKKAEDERRSLSGAEKQIQEFSRANNLVTLENKVAVLPQQLSEVSTELIRAQTKRRSLEALYDKVRKVANDPQAAETIPAIANDPAVQTLQTQILKAEQNIMELSGQYGYKHPVMVKARGDLNVLRKKKAQEIARAIASIKNQYELARSDERNLSAQLNVNKSDAQRTNEKYIQYQALNRNLQTNQKLYDALLEKIKEQSITGENQASVNFWVLDEARTPTIPAEPRTMVNALLGLVVGLVGGIGLAFLIEYLDNTIKDPEEAEAALGSPVLGVITLSKAKEPAGEIVLKEPRSPFAENYKALRTALLLSSSEGAPRRLLVTSPGSGEGKTTTAANLALVLAQSEKRVLLIDGDLRKPRQHKVFGTSNKKGLSTYLAGTSAGDILSKSPLPELAILPSGPVPPNPSELLTSSRMESLLETLSKEFDIIICDSPPLLSVADSRILSRFFDGTILVTLGGRTTYDMARRALRLLQDVRGRALGLVINGLDVKKGDYYYSEYYSSYEEDQKSAVTRLERMVS